MSDIKQWSQEQIDKMMELYHQRYSAERIGRAIGRTKNAVIGKLHRLGFQKPSALRQPFKIKLIPHATPVPDLK